MSDKLTLAAEKRTEFGKGAARRARAAHKIPAVIYGHGSDPVHILLPGHDTMMALKHSNALLTIELDGSSETAIAKDVQVEPVRRIIEHVDLLLVKKGEKITVDVPVHVVGESFAGTIHVVEHATVQILAEATHLPESLEVSIEGLEEGARVYARDIELPKGSELVTDADAAVVVISVPRGAGAEEEEAEAAAAEAPAEADAE
ncbi:50S ribosomal protein L25/general stress protein Ctc [Demequina sp. SYSU T00039]|uniref:Large ribosomal subunit protein bL25 n=1 Tax=Demequina lignilytica TaxID=3051663 RepID=A0AAW7M3I4_9MICO|nr:MULTISPECIES: 50S ribosomal protein L25/general stress protein Ctc [unclassified Demequina]MDN4477582.1 50S ribosomal protein L25/general stress protein Ctc [Demequina sp. SYSU T00039-1]MDN4488067.1 50S ribosomal protein L25/general stress protein Ctc [Demequina sp. SYSU T00039]